jgi:hypothetical protein
MPLTMTVDERAALQAAQAHRRAVRHWRRYQAVLLRADGVPIATIAQTRSDAVGEVVWEVRVDSSTARAYQHARGLDAAGVG